MARSWLGKVVWMVGLSVLYLLARLNVEYPVLRFEWPPLNPGFLLLASCIPWAVGFIGSSIRWWIGLALLGCLSLISPVEALAQLVALPMFAGIETGATIVAGYEPTFSPLQAMNFDGYRVVAYDDECGPPCPITTVVQQERGILPGVMLVRDFRTPYDSDSPTFVRLGTDRLRMRIRDLDNGAYSNILYDFRPWVYW